jgi:predicted nucleic acid-binding protein
MTCGATASSSMVLIDSSVWINFYNKHDTTSAFDEVISLGEAATTDLIITEVLQGFRLADVTRYRTALGDLNGCHYVPMFSKELAIQSADNYRTLSSTGITPRSTIDVLLATLCIERGISFLTADTTDFLPIANTLNLNLMTA